VDPATRLLQQFWLTVDLVARGVACVRRMALTVGPKHRAVSASSRGGARLYPVRCLAVHCMQACNLVLCSLIDLVVWRVTVVWHRRAGSALDPIDNVWLLCSCPLRPPRGLVFAWLVDEPLISNHRAVLFRVSSQVVSHRTLPLELAAWT
jgi:hypothetical protein